MGAQEVAVRTDLPYLRFVLEHLVPRVPVLVPGASANMPAMNWTPASLRARVGKVAVRVDVGGHIEHWPLGLFLDRMQAGELARQTPPPYMRNASLVEFFPELIEDVQLPSYCYPNWLETEALFRFIPPVWTRWIELFVSGPGTRFPRVHVDSSMTHAWVVGLQGRKRFWAWPPQAGQPCYSIHSTSDQAARGLDCVGKDLDTFFSHARPVEAVIGPGDFLFLPTGWWHTAESLTTSVSISGNFVNETNWSEFVACWFDGLKHLDGLMTIGEALQVSAGGSAQLTTQPPKESESG